MSLTSYREIQLRHVLESLLMGRFEPATFNTVGEFMVEQVNRVGCCGYAVSHARYYRTFPVIEIQQTFYQPPLPATARRWRDEAPEGFEFTIKAWQLITHEASSPTYRRLREALSEEQKKQAGGFRWSDLTQRGWDRTMELVRILRTDKVVFQCPASFAPSERNKDRMRKFFTRIEREDLHCIWEPRGEWTRSEIESLCRELNLTHCVDPFRSAPALGGLRYYRLHGIGGYRHTYTRDELRDLAEKCMKRTPAYFMFNNQTMFEDAVRFSRSISSR